MVREFIYTPTFLKKWDALGFREEDLRTLELSLLQKPDTGKLIEGTGGIRKLRFAFPHRGKSGSARVCYVDFDNFGKTYFIHVYSKEEKQNLSKSEKNLLRIAVDKLKEECRRNML